MSDRDSLISMGFPSHKVDKALRSTKNAGLQPALDYLVSHADDPDDENDKMDAEDVGGGEESAELPSASDGPGEAKSLRCMVCGKVFKNTALASFHGDKSGHDQFEESTEEIKPLTEEEKAQRLAELRERMLEKKAEQAKRDAEEAKKNEMIRRKAGKDMGSVKADMEKKEADQLAKKARQDKIDDAAALKRVKDQIEADKKARADKAAKDKALRAGMPVPQAATTEPEKPESVKPAATSHKEARLSIRLPSGPPLTTIQPSSSTLRSLASWLSAQPAASTMPTPIRFSIPFPRRIFSDADMDVSLQELGLTPSSVLNVV